LVKDTLSALLPEADQDESMANSGDKQLKHINVLRRRQAPTLHFLSPD